jgi:endonuclease/exonuclease/phosphatase family metal-dependent hydrolase
MTYNILNGGAQPDRLDAIADIVRTARPDILAMQECTDFERDGTRTLYTLERTLGMRGVLAEAASGYHVVLFVRDLTIVAAHRATSGFHHCALRVELLHGNTSLFAIAAHLCPQSAEARVREAQHLASLVRSERVVAMGDMNAISPRDVMDTSLHDTLQARRVRHLIAGTETLDTRAVAVLEAAGLVDLWRRAHPHGSCVTSPTALVGREGRPALRLDYIFATPMLARTLVRCDLLADTSTERASDHYPIIADIDL